MPTKNEAIQFDGKGASFAKYLNEDVRLVVESTGKQVDNMADMVNQVNLEKDVIKAYCEEFESMLKANGKDQDTVKQMKATRKCILEFGAGLRKGQLDAPEKWSKGEGKRMIQEHFRKEAGSLNQLAKLCRDATKLEEPEKPWDLGEKLNALLEKAQEEGYSQADVYKALDALTGTAEAA